MYTKEYTNFFHADENWSTGTLLTNHVIFIFVLVVFCFSIGPRHVVSEQCQQRKLKRRRKISVTRNYRRETLESLALSG